MKIKRLAEDFCVEEQIDLRPDGGPFALYRLTKQSLGTREAADAIAQKWNVRRDRLAFAGLKDKHARTMQFVTIEDGPRRGLAQTNFQVEYVGQAARPVHASDIRANRFTVVIRDLTDADKARVEVALASVGSDGLPNYFDDQRFGSLGQSGEFIARPWCLGDYERAIWLAIADANVHDRSQDRQERHLLREQWGQWQHLAVEIRNEPRRSIVEHLARSRGDFRRAIALVPQDLRSLWIAALQSDLWNQVLAALVRETCSTSQLTVHRIGPRDVSFFEKLDAAQRSRLSAADLPLPSARDKLDGHPLKSIYDRVLAAEGLELRQLRVKYPRDSFFSKGSRAAIVVPAEFQHEFAADDLYPGRQKLALSFLLPRGAYATILVKRIVGPGANALAEDD